MTAKKIYELIKTKPYLESINQKISSEIHVKPVIKIELIGRLIPFDELENLIKQIYKINHAEYEIIVRWNNYT